MKISSKKVYLTIATALIFTAFFTTQAFQVEEEYRVETHVEIKSVKDWPPISNTSPIYSGTDYTQLGARSFFQYMSSKGLVAVDSQGNKYYIPGYEHVNTSTYELHQSNRNQYRLCNDYGCITITSIERSS